MSDKLKPMHIPDFVERILNVSLSPAQREMLMENSAVPAHGEDLRTNHFRGELENGRKFVYCPVGNITSWHEGDYDHKWCAWCRIFYVQETGRRP